jgi:hypothetical protein
MSPEKRAKMAIEEARKTLAKLREKFTKPLYMGEPAQAPGSTLLTRNLRGSSSDPDAVPFDPEDWSIN